MRNGVLAVIGAVVSHEMADPVNLSEQQRDTRDQLLDKLQVLYYRYYTTGIILQVLYYHNHYRYYTTGIILS